MHDRLYIIDGNVCKILNCCERKCVFSHCIFSFTSLLFLLYFGPAVGREIEVYRLNFQPGDFDLCSLYLLCFVTHAMSTALLYLYVVLYIIIWFAIVLF